MSATGMAIVLGRGRLSRPPLQRYCSHSVGSTPLTTGANMLDGEILEDRRGLVVIPVHNEQENLGEVIRDLRAEFRPRNVLFVNDGSTDRSESILRESGLPYVNHPVNLGYQEALKTGIYAALAGGFAYVLFFDSDGQHRLEDLRRIIDVHVAAGSDLIVGSRYATGEHSGLSTRSIGTWLFSLMTTLLTGVRFTDVTCGLKLVSRPFLPVALQLPAEDMHAEFIVGLARCGASVQEEPIEVMPRSGGDSMYSITRAVLYPLKTAFVLVASVAFAGGLRPLTLERDEVKTGPPKLDEVGA